jgi:hypothetical protein
LACRKQVLLGSVVPAIIAHWFDLEGRFLGLERCPVAVDPPTFPGTTIYRTDAAYHRELDLEMAALKERLGFESADIRVQAFKSADACITDLPGEYEEFLRTPESFSPEDRDLLEGFISQWRREGRFVLEWHVEHWMSAEGEVLGRSG